MVIIIIMMYRELQDMSSTYHVIMREFVETVYYERVLW